MISILHGTVASVGLDHIDIVVGGIGFRVHVTPAFAQGASRDQEMTVFTSMIVREDSMTLYGFESADERDVFTKLLSVSGMSMFSVHDVMPTPIIPKANAANRAR